MGIAAITILLVSLRCQLAHSLHIGSSRHTGAPTGWPLVDSSKERGCHFGSEAKRLGSLAAKAVDDRVDASARSSQYYLLWSPGMLPKFAISVVALYVVPTVLAKSFVTSYHERVAVPWLHQLLLSLFASACCAIQLFLNALSIGCAGFNKVLGPFRPFLVSLLFYVSIRHSRPRGLVWRWAVALLPELLHGWNQLRSRYSTECHRDMTAKTLTIHVPTMGCVACINSIQNAVSSVPGVESVKASLLQKTGGKAVIVMSDSIDTQKVLKSIEDAGFRNPTIALKETRRSL